MGPRCPTRKTLRLSPPDSEGLSQTKEENPEPPKSGRTRSYAHHNRDLSGSTPNPLAVAFTEDQTIGGSAWPNVKFERRDHEIAYSLWGQLHPRFDLHTGITPADNKLARGIMPITAARSMPTLDVTQLSEDQLQTAQTIFDELKNLDFLPANEAYRDETRKLLDRRLLIDLLNLPEAILEPLDLLRLKWCNEPSVHGGKPTAPNGSAT